MTQTGIFRRRHLPHWDVEGHPFFITACLEGSISAAGLKRIRQYRLELDTRPPPDDMSEQDWERHKDKLVFARVDDLLDHHSPVQHLADERQAEIVQNAFLHFAGVRYTLLAFVVMPSHHHWLFLSDEQWGVKAVQRSIRPDRRQKTPREIISHSIQSYTATMCNRVRGGSGAYWQTETFDHWARDEDEMLRIIVYIENNPVKAGLVERPEDWPFSSQDSVRPISSPATRSSNWDRLPACPTHLTSMYPTGWKPIPRKHVPDRLEAYPTKARLRKDNATNCP